MLPVTNLKYMSAVTSNMETTYIQNMKRQIQLVSSQDKSWEIHYFHDQYHGLAELACEKENATLPKRFTKETIELARAMRTELLKRHELVCFGFSTLFHLDGTPFSFSEVERFD